MFLKLKQVLRAVFHVIPTSAQTHMKRVISIARDLATSYALKRAGMSELEHNDFNHVLHHLRGVELKRLQKNVKSFISVGCAGTWYFHWIEQCCGSIGCHIGIEYYSPKPDDLPPNVEWIVNTASDMSLIEDETGDILFSGQNIEHLWPSEVAGFLCESHRVLKLGGLLVIDSPNRLVTSQLEWSHPEHTIELTPDEACDLVELSGFDVITSRGMWLCSDAEQAKIVPLDELRNTGAWSVERRVTEAYSRPNDSFSWWIEARKTDRIPDKEKVKEKIATLFRRAWPERVNRLLTLIGTPVVFEGRSWLCSNLKSGVLMYGPYMPLPAGDYTVRFELRNGCEAKDSKDLGEIARVDVVSGDGDELATSNISASMLSDNESTYASLKFNLDAMTFGIQFRSYSFWTQKYHGSSIDKVNMRNYFRI